MYHMIKVLRKLYCPFWDSCTTKTWGFHQDKNMDYQKQKKGQKHGTLGIALEKVVLNLDLPGLKGIFPKVTWTCHGMMMRFL